MLKKVEKIFKNLSDKNRLRILLMLTKGTLCVCEIQDVLNVTVSTVSKHLSILKESGFIIDEKDGKWVNYKLNISTKDPQIQQILLMLPMWLNDDEVINSDLSKISNIDRNIICGTQKNDLISTIDKM